MQNRNEVEVKAYLGPIQSGGSLSIRDILLHLELQN